MNARGFIVGFAGLTCLLGPGCSPIGPKTVPMDRAQYSEALSESWMKQTLMNIVKLRYLNPPFFVDVASVVGGYSIETEMSAGAAVVGPNMPDTATLGARYRYTDRPTITYLPLTGNRFMRGLMTPIRPEELFFAVQSGWSAEVILMAGLASISGLRNVESGIDGASAPDPDFIRVIQLLEKIRKSGAVSLRIVTDEQKRMTTLVTLQDDRVPEDVKAAGQELRRLLRLNATSREFRLVQGAVAANDTELAVRTRSMLQIMSLIAMEMEVPEEHIAAGRTVPGPKSDLPPFIRVHCGGSAPSDAMAAVPYRGYWFWVDDRDLRSKRSFSFLMMLFNMAETGETAPLPVLTISTQ